MVSSEARVQLRPRELWVQGRGTVDVTSPQFVCQRAPHILADFSTSGNMGRSQRRTFST